MTQTVMLDAIYRPSEDIVTREIEGELILIPLMAGIGDIEDELFALNPTGKAIWESLDGCRTLTEVIDTLGARYAQPATAIREDVT